MIAERIRRTVFHKFAPTRINHIAVVTWNNATGLVKDVYVQMDRDFGLVPPLTIHSAIPELLAGAWSIARESMMAGSVDRSEREAVAAAVSKINECPFCVDVHTTMLHAGSHHGEARSVIDGDLDALPNSRIADIIQWARATRTPDDPILRNPPFANDEAPFYVGTALAFHYINRMVNVFLEDSPYPSIPQWLKHPFARIGGSVVGKQILNTQVAPGESLALIDDGDLPEEIGFLAAEEHVAGAFARLSGVIERIGRRALSDDVRNLVHHHVQEWNGGDPGMSRRWIEDAVANLPEEDVVTARLALLTALASYQIDESLIEDFRRQHPTDADLVGVTAWASFVAMKRNATWLAPARVNVAVA